MDRRTQADKAFLKWSEDTSKNVIHIVDAWYAAVEWADSHPNLYSVTRKAIERERKYMIEKVCKWLDENMEDYAECSDLDNEVFQRLVISSDYDYKKDFIEAFRKAMEQ